MSLVDLGTTLHTDQLTRSRLVRLLPIRIARAIYKELTRGPVVYGLEWGDPDVWTPLRFIRDKYVVPFVSPDHIAVDIGCGSQMQVVFCESRTSTGHHHFGGGHHGGAHH